VQNRECSFRVAVILETRFGLMATIEIESRVAVTGVLADFRNYEDVRKRSVMAVALDGLSV
jgi:hypothetical protein